MDFLTIEGLIMTYAPLLVTVISIVVAFVKFIKEIKSIRQVNEEEKNELFNQLKNAVRENIVLKKKMNEILEKIDHIERT